MQVERAALQANALRIVRHTAGPHADADALARAAHQAFDQLAAVLTPIIGRVGIDALVARALHLAERDQPWLAVAQNEPGDNRIARLAPLLGQQTPDVALDAAALILANFSRLLATLVGAPLTLRLIRQAWPAAFPDPETKETSR